MSRQSGAQCRFHRFGTADLTDNHHIGVFTERKLQRLLKSPLLSGRDLALGDHGFFAHMKIFDGIFDHQNMFFKVLIDEIHYGGQGGGLTAAGGTCHKNQSP